MKKNLFLTKKIIYIFFYLAIIFLIFLIFKSALTNSSAFYNNILDTLDIWLIKVFPSLFTFYIISSAIINFHLLNLFNFLFKPLQKLFKFETQEALQIFIISIFSGNPMTTILTISSLNNKTVTNKDASTLLKCAAFPSPFFVIAFFGNSLPAYLMIASIILVNFLVALFLTRKNNQIIIKQKALDLTNNFLSSIDTIISTLLLIAGTMVLSSIIKYSILDFGKKNSFIKIFLITLELSTGLNDILQMNLNFLLTYLLSVFLLSFNGFCIHLQVLVTIKNKLKYSQFFIYRLFSAFLSVLVFLIFYFLFIK